MRRALPAILAVTVALLLQAGLAPYMALGGVTPNFLLIAVVTLALSSGPEEGAAAGFAAGLLFDLLGTGPLGPMALVLAVVGFVAGLIHKQMFAEGWLLPLTVFAVAALLTEVSYALVLDLLGGQIPFWRAVLRVMLPGAVYHTTLALLIYPWLARYLRREQPMKTFRRLA